MTRLRLFIIIGLFLIGLSGCSSSGLLNSVMPADSVKNQLRSAQDHLNHAQMLEQDLGRLEEQVARIDQRVARYEQKPYLDPKRFRRDGLRILRGSNLKEIETLQEKVAWHRVQASQLANLDSSNQDQTLNGGRIGSEQMTWSGIRVTKRTPVGQRSDDITTVSSS